MNSQVAGMAGGLSNSIMSVVVYGLNQLTLSSGTKWVMSIVPPFALQLALNEGLQMDTEGGLHPEW